MLVLAGIFPEAELLNFEVPVAEIVPDEIPERLTRLVISMRLQALVNSRCANVEPIS